ncbi:MAG: hypothetical protein EOP40_07165 [Rubrivivax sp.]|nr:MAG: hypothetical protein EOP40_07165 [Rubrivivax sp.]
MKKTIHLARLLGLTALALSGAVQAATTWYLKDVTFNRAPGESIDQATGWFVFDEATNTYTDWNIAVASSTGQASSFVYDSAVLSNKIAWGDASNGLFRAEESRDLAYVMSLSFAESLATAPTTGEVALTGGGISRVFRQYSMTAGLVSGSITTSAVPEASTSVAFALGLLGMVAVARRRRI